MNELLALYRQHEATNNHGACAKLLVDNFGTDHEKSIIESINTAHDRRGHILQHEVIERQRVSNKYYKLLIASTH
jgi:hypothetical protein